MGSRLGDGPLQGCSWTGQQSSGGFIWARHQVITTLASQGATSAASWGGGRRDDFQKPKESQGKPVEAASAGLSKYCESTACQPVTVHDGLPHGARCVSGVTPAGEVRAVQENVARAAGDEGE
jgi:hypothetical protein